MKLGIVGAGYWGSKIVNSVGNLAEVTVMDIKNGDDWQNDHLDAVIIATPADQHYAMTRWYLEQGIHVLCEKPSSRTSREQQELNELAKSNNLIYQAGHILLFQPNVEAMLDYVADRQVIHIESRRLNWGRLQTNLDLAWHLAPHDISVIDKITHSTPTYVYPKSITHNLNSSPQIDYATFDLTYQQMSATITLSWHWPRKVREFVVTCEDAQLWLDDTELHIIQGGWRDGQLSQSGASVYKFNQTKTPLEAQIEDFVRCVTDGGQPRADMSHMLRVVETVEMMSRPLHV